MSLQQYQINYSSILWSTKLFYNFDVSTVYVMMRNKTAFIFVFLANIILLAHIFIPHHHHTEAPIEIAIECNHNEQHSHLEHVPFCNADHEQGETIPCFLTTVIFIPNNELRANIFGKQMANSDVLLFALFVLNYTNISIIQDFKIDVFKDIPLNSRLLSSSQGQRAPPVC